MLEDSRGWSQTAGVWDNGWRQETKSEGDSRGRPGMAGVPNEI